MTPDYAQAIGRMAYIWGWPLVNMQNRRATITQAPQPSLMHGVIPVAPMNRLAMLTGYIKPTETFIACPNQDVAYGLGYFALKGNPAVIQVPDFGDRFWVYAMYDGRTDQFGTVGKPYGTKPGFYLLVGPGWQGTAPKGISGVIRSNTEFANVVPRVFMDDTDEDRAAIQPLISQIVAYPLSEFDGKMKTVDYSKLPSLGDAADTSGGETQWVVPEKFFDQLGDVLDRIPPLPGEEALYAQFRQLLAIADKDPAIKKALVQAAIDTDKSVIRPFLQWEHNGVPAGNGWNRSKNNAQWGVDYFDRTGTARSNLLDNRPAETQYFYTDFDSGGNKLKGDSLYAVTFPKGQLPPVRGFWSLTLYNDKHLFHQNDLERFSLGTKNKMLKYNPDGSLTLYAGAKSPGKDREPNWLPAPDGDFSLYIRAYWGKAGILDGSWQPPKVEKIE
ncbi:DUF1254 domain-containing protein [Microbulbifer taiwanensis]